MSKLREKLNNSIITNIEIRESENLMYFEYNHLELAEQCEQIADDFAVYFAEWLYEKPSPFPKEVDLSTTELLQIFKSKYYERSKSKLLCRSFMYLS